MIYPNGHIDYVMYKNGGELIGIAKVTVPEVNYKTVEVVGAGVMGSVNIPLASMIDPMSLNIDFSSVADAIVELGSNEWHDVALMAADQYFDSEAIKEEIEAIRFEMTIRPTGTKAGSIAVATAADASGTYSVCKYKVFKNDEVVVNIDQFNRIHEINGKDCAANVRKALGMMG